MGKSAVEPAWADVSTASEGVELTGRYLVDGTGWMTVRLDGGGSKSARAGLAPEGTARLILWELHRERSDP